MSTSTIEWTQQTWNPVTGCTRVSAGCDKCYAFTMTRRLAGMGQEKYQGLINPGKKHFNGVVKTHEEVLTLPLQIKKPTTFFVNSMSDLFHEGVPFDFIDRVFAVMALTPRHTYQILTKRPWKMAMYFDRLKSLPTVMWAIEAGYMNFPDEQISKIRIVNFPLPNVWLGTSIEDQKTADERIPHLLKAPAAVRFLSCEPLLKPVDLTNMDVGYAGDPDWCFINCLNGRHNDMGRPCPPVPVIHWVIAGGESGPGARPMHPDWVRSLRDQCQAAGVAFFFKQWGAYGPDSVEGKTIEKPVVENGIGYLMQKVGKKAAGRLLDGVEWNEMPLTINF